MSNAYAQFPRPIYRLVPSHPSARPHWPSSAPDPSDGGCHVSLSVRAQKAGCRGLLVSCGGFKKATLSLHVADPVDSA